MQTTKYRIIQDERILMNTKVEFTAWTDKERDLVHSIFDQGFQQFHFVIEKFSRFDPKSELSRLNARAGKTFVATKELFNLVKHACKLARLSNGSFDPTIIDFLETYGYGAKYDFERLSKTKLIQKEIIKLLINRPSFGDIKFNTSSRSIRLHSNQRIDLGGLGKGYAIDLAYSKLLPLENFLINAGGDVAAHGGYDKDSGWYIELNARTEKNLGKVLLRNRSICCSGSFARKVKFFHHLIDPKTGRPQNDLQSVFVICDSAMNADSWATALFASGKKAEGLIRRHKIRALLIDDKNKIRSFNFPNRIVAKSPSP